MPTFDASPATASGKRTHYRELNEQLASLLSEESDGLANAANLVALFFHALPDVNWLGCYWLRGAELVLGPFQGKVACVRIAVGRGVCGTAARDRTTIVVPDVHAFPDHIACDTASRSEIVVPLVRGEHLLGVLDVDSPCESRFDAADAEGLETASKLLVDSSDFSRLTD